MNYETILFAVVFFLPAGVSNMFPVFASKLPILKNLNLPLDLGKTYKGKPIFGKNKTYRGIISGTIAGTLVAFLIYSLSGEFGRTYVLAGALMSFGALLGDAVESFFKRQKGVPSGKPWFPFDQTDYIIGGLLLVLPLGIVNIVHVLWIFIIYFGLHLLSSYIGYLIKLKDAPI